MKTIWHNGKFYTMEAEGHMVEALLTENGKIVAVGTYEELKDQAADAIDLQGAVLYPGFIDNHMHLIGHGEKLLRLDLSKAASFDELMDCLRDEASRLQPGEWLIGEGWNEHSFPDRRLPARVELDQITDSPIFLRRACWHAALVNTKALEVAGITKDTPTPSDGVIERDADGEPTGLLKEGPMLRLLQQLPQPDEAYLTKALNTAVEHLLSLGLTGVVTDDLGYYGDVRKPLDAFQHVIGSKWKFRTHLLRHFSVFPELMKEHLQVQTPFISYGEMKFFIDGALGGRTALLSKPYADDPSNFGTAVLTDEEIKKLVLLARQHNEAVAIHTIGDAAVEKALDAIETAPPPPGMRDRLIHVTVLRDDLVERMAKLPIVLDLQPAFVPSDFPWVIERLGNERLDWAYAWKRLLQHGFICGGGSDAPIEDPNPLLGIYAALARKAVGEEGEGYIPKEKLTRFEAIHLFTAGAAATIGAAESRGKLSVGFDADFTVLDQDLFTIDIEQIPEANVQMTVVAGEIMYESQSSS